MVADGTKNGMWGPISSFSCLSCVLSVCGSLTTMGSRALQPPTSILCLTIVNPPPPSLSPIALPSLALFAPLAAPLAPVGDGVVNADNGFNRETRHGFKG